MAYARDAERAVRLVMPSPSRDILQESHRLGQTPVESANLADTESAIRALVAEPRDRLFAVVATSLLSLRKLAKV